MSSVSMFQAQSRTLTAPATLTLALTQHTSKQGLKAATGPHTLRGCHVDCGEAHGGAHVNEPAASKTLLTTQQKGAMSAAVACEPAI